MYNFTVKKTGTGEYTIYSEGGVEMHVYHGCTSVDDAMFKANAYISSWSGSQVRLVDEQDET